MILFILKYYIDKIQTAAEIWVGSSSNGSLVSQLVAFGEEVF